MNGQQNQQTRIRPIMPAPIGNKVKKGQKGSKKKKMPSFNKVQSSVRKTMGY